MIRAIIAYWLRPVGHIEVYRYHLEKVGHTLLIGLLFAPVLSPLGIDAPHTTVIAAVAYLVIGKILVRSHFSADHIADLLIGMIAVPFACFATGAVQEGAVLLIALATLYAIVVLWKRRASP